MEHHCQTNRAIVKSFFSACKKQAMNWKIFCFVLCCIYCKLHFAASLKCHVCSSMNPGQEDCEEVSNEDTKYLEDCGKVTNASCRIQEQWVDFQVLLQKSGKRTIRQCASTPFDPARACYYRAGFGGKVNVCNCIGDGCNQSSALTVTVTVLFLTLGSLLLLKNFH